MHLSITVALSTRSRIKFRKFQFSPHKSNKTLHFAHDKLEISIFQSLLANLENDDSGV